MTTVDAVVVGGGMAGIASALRLRQAGLSCVVLEAESVVGGRVRTVDASGVRVELGAAFIASMYSETLKLLDGAPEAVELQPRAQPVDCLLGGDLVPLWPLANLKSSSLLSVTDKVHALGLAVPLLTAWSRLSTLDLPRARSLDVRSVGDVCRRWAGQAVTESLVGPLLRGLFYWDINDASQVGLLLMLKEASAGLDLQKPSAGMSALAGSLAAVLDVETDCAVASIDVDGDGFLVQGYSGRTWHSRAVVVAAPAPVASELCADLLRPEDLSFLRGVRYSSTASLVFESANGRDLGNRTILFRSADSPMIVSVNPVGSSSEDEDRVYSVFLSGEGYEAISDMRDDEAAIFVLAELERLIPHHGFGDVSTLQLVHRWHHALPGFEVGYIEALASFPDLPVGVGGLAFAGDYLGGPHIEGAVLSGQRAADRISRFLRAH